MKPGTLGCAPHLDPVQALLLAINRPLAGLDQLAARVGSEALDKDRQDGPGTCGGGRQDGLPTEVVGHGSNLLTAFQRNELGALGREADRLLRRPARQIDDVVQLDFVGEEVTRQHVGDGRAHSLRKAPELRFRHLLRLRQVQGCEALRWVPAAAHGPRAGTWRRVSPARCLVAEPPALQRLAAKRVDCERELSRVRGQAGS